jgi:hypothetical protein
MQDMHRELGVFQALFKALNSVPLDLYYACGDATAETQIAGFIHYYDRK